MKKRKQKKFLKEIGAWGKGFDAVVIHASSGSAYDYHNFKRFTPVIIKKIMRSSDLLCIDANGREQRIMRHDLIKMRQRRSV